MFKTSDQRLRQGLDAIRLHVGPTEADYIDEELSRGVRLRYAPLLDMGGYEGTFRNSGEKAQRNAVRGLLLTGLVLGAIQDAAVTPALKSELSALPLDEVARRMKRAFPFRAFSGRYSNLDSWDPAGFTKPVDGTAASYRFIVHGIVASRIAMGKQSEMTKLQWDALLDRFSGVADQQQQTTALRDVKLEVNVAEYYLKDWTSLRAQIVSTSVITQKKHATYHPFGFILRVPKENVYSASSKDQSVANRTTDAVAELQKVYTSKAGGRLLTPDEVLDGTTGGQGKNGYNEVVVVGTSPEGKAIDVIGIYLKVHPNGNLYVDPTAKGPAVTPELLELIKVQQRKGMPVVRIVDASSGPSTHAVGL